MAGYDPVRDRGETPRAASSGRPSNPDAAESPRKYVKRGAGRAVAADGLAPGGAPSTKREAERSDSGAAPSAHEQPEKRPLPYKPKWQPPGYDSMLHVAAPEEIREIKARSQNPLRQTNRYAGGDMSESRSGEKPGENNVKAQVQLHCTYCT